MGKKKLLHEVRVNKSGCLSECAIGPVLVIYPQGIWYKNIDLDDISDIIQETIINDKIIKRLLIK